MNVRNIIKEEILKEIKVGNISLHGYYGDKFKGKASSDWLTLDNLRNGDSKDTTDEYINALNSIDGKNIPMRIWNMAKEKTLKIGKEIFDKAEPFLAKYRIKEEGNRFIRLSCVDKFKEKYIDFVINGSDGKNSTVEFGTIDNSYVADTEYDFYNFIKDYLSKYFKRRKNIVNPSFFIEKRIKMLSMCSNVIKALVENNIYDGFVTTPRGTSSAKTLSDGIVYIDNNGLLSNYERGTRYRISVHDENGYETDIIEVIQYNSGNVRIGHCNNVRIYGADKIRCIPYDVAQKIKDIALVTLKNALSNDTN